MLTAYRAPIGPHVVNWEDAARDSAEMERRFRSTTHVFTAQVAQLGGLPRGRRSELDLALALSPADPQVASCEAELDREITDLRRLVETNSQQSVFALRLANKLFLALRWEEAGRILEPFLSRRPPPPVEVFTQLAEIRHHFGQPDVAESLLRQGLSAWPESYQAHDLLAGLLLRSGRGAEARRHIERALELQPGDPLVKRHHEEITRRTGGN
jgi:tetratricopeptide (TPR) repeat protein